jgi:hypothetical protein
MQSAAKHLARFVADALVTAPREMLRYALHDKRRYRNLLNSRFSTSSAHKKASPDGLAL